MRRSDGEMAELVADALVEARTGELRQAADRVEEADLERRPGGKLGGLAAIHGDLDRLALGRVVDVEHVPRRAHEGAGGERVRRDVADDVALPPPGQNRSLVGEVVAGRADGSGSDEAVAADVPDLLAGNPIAELGDAVVGPAGEGDVVEADR